MSGVKKNIAYSVIYQIIVTIVPLIVSPYLSRVILKEGIGQYTYTHSIAHYFVLFTMMGLVNYGNRAIAKSREDVNEKSKTFFEIYFMQVAFGLISLLFYAGFILLFGEGNFTLFLLQGLYLLSAILDISWYFYGVEQVKKVLVRNGLFRIIMVLGIFVFVKKPEDVWIYTLIMAGGTFLSQFIMWIGLRKHFVKTKIEFKSILKHIKPNVILFLPVIAVSLYRIMDKIMVGAMVSFGETGLYENADKLVVIPLTLVTAVGTVMMPRLSNMFAKGAKSECFVYIRDSMQILAALSVGMSFGIAAIGERFAPLYFGAGFEKSGILISILSPIILFSTVANVIRTQYLIPTGKDKGYLLSVSLGAIVNLIFNLIFIPKLQSIGAAIGTVLAEFVVMTTQCFLARKELNLFTYISDSWIYVVAGIAMFVILKVFEMFVSASYFSIVIEVFLGVLVFAVVSLLMMVVFQRKRTAYFMKMIRRKRGNN